MRNLVLTRFATRVTPSMCPAILIGAIALATACTREIGRAPSRAATSPAAAEVRSNADGDEIVVRTNAERQKLGLPTLTRSAALMNAAQLQADQMAALNKMEHDLPGAAYPTPGSRLDAVGYRMSASGENVAEGYSSPKAVVAGWMTSPGHRENIVSTKFTEMGAGVATAKNGRKFYSQVFGHPRFGS